jgi:hypothetical protein
MGLAKSCIIETNIQIIFTLGVGDQKMCRQGTPKGSFVLKKSNKIIEKSLNLMLHLSNKTLCSIVKSPLSNYWNKLQVYHIAYARLIYNDKTLILLPKSDLTVKLNIHWPDYNKCWRINDDAFSCINLLA